MSSVPTIQTHEHAERASGPSSVLSTLNQDGSRRWLTPRLSPGRLWKRRRIAAYGLIALFTLLPYVVINGKPAVLLDVPARRFTLFGSTFLPTDTLLLALLVVGIFVGIFLVTALLGRVWCGWTCPQTVYMEFLYRPLERFFDGAPGRPKKTKGVQGWLHQSGASKPLKYVAFFFASCFLAHTFLAYFVGVDQLAQWVTQSPLKHPTPFLVMALVTAAMMFDFAFFREQTCLVACPYGRFQSVMLDRQSLIVSYDRTRGEPRGRWPSEATQDGSIALPIFSVHNTQSRVSDCVDCSLCVTTCPTGIDIRNGLQMECVNCAQCIDACDAVMDKLQRPRGLIRYSSQTAMAGQRISLLRPRVIAYPLLLTIIVGAFVTLLLTRAPAYISVGRGTGAPFYVLPSGEIANPMRVSLINRTNEPATFEIAVVDGQSRLLAENTTLTLQPSEGRVVRASVAVPRESFVSGSHQAQVRVRMLSPRAYESTQLYRLVGPGGHPGSGLEPIPSQPAPASAENPS